MLFGHPLCQSRESLQTGRSGSEEFPRAAGDDEERGKDTGPLTPDRRCAEPAERQTCPFDWTYIHIYLNTSFSSDLPQTKALPCGARVTSSTPSSGPQMSFWSMPCGCAKTCLFWRTGSQTATASTADPSATLRSSLGVRAEVP
jgi:hypothetical protein